MRSEVPHLYCVILGAGFVVGGSEDYSTAIFALIREVASGSRKSVRLILAMDSPVCSGIPLLVRK